MKIPALLLASFAVLLVACGGKVVVDAPTGSGGGGGGSTSSSTISTSSGSVCPPHSSAGCCFGDGTCCDCVSSTVCTLGTFGSITAEVTTFDDCVCAAAVCGPTCVAACGGGGIDVGCQECAAKAATGPCAAQFAACPINTSGG